MFIFTQTKCDNLALIKRKSTPNSEKNKEQRKGMLSMLNYEMQDIL